MTEGGRIINISSTNAGRMPFAGGAVYAMSKSALTGLAKGMARDLGRRGITINNVNPGPVDTDMNPADHRFRRRPARPDGAAAPRQGRGSGGHGGLPGAESAFVRRNRRRLRAPAPTCDDRWRALDSQ
jgi:NAD(P)-dependent dehydrogenase (short-subunit alcohol dehydrogenase family)